MIFIKVVLPNHVYENEADKIFETIVFFLMCNYNIFVLLF